MTGRRAYVLAAAALLMAAGAVAYGVVRLSSDDEPAEVVAPEETAAPIDDWLLASNRANLSLCVDGAAGLTISGEDVETVHEALDSALASQPSVPPEYDNPTVSQGCPPPSAQLGQPISKYDIEGAVVTVPTDHLMFIYLVPARVYAATFGWESGSERYVSAHEEDLCVLDECTAVTTGLYVSHPIDADALRDGLLEGLALVLPTPVPDSTVPPGYER